MAILKPRARIIRTIGDQLISGPEAALIELVKNAYDADATWIKIKIAPICEEYPTGLVSVLDNGHGMSRSDIEDNWFEPATDNKQKRRVSRSGLRTMLGAKGIGRFASSRLGTATSLTTISKVGNSNNQYEETWLEIDWTEFESNKYLHDLDIPIHSRIVLTAGNEKVQSGVCLQITNSRVKWTQSNAEKLIKELRRLVSPRDVQGEFKIFLDLSSFKKISLSDSFDGSELLRKNLSEDTSSEVFDGDKDPFCLILPYRIQDKADYLLKGEFTETGEFSGSFFVERGDNAEQKIFIPAPPIALLEDSCGPFKIKIQIYDRESEAVDALFARMGLDLKKVGLRRARQILNENSGIGVYRDGFRVRPYGEADNDWLMLESRRVQDPSKRIGHTQASGHILIGSEEATKLVERSSREGFEHNGAFERLKSLITTVLIRAEEKRFDYRQNAGLSRKVVGDVEQIKKVASLSTLTDAAEKLPIEHRKFFLEKIQKESVTLTKSLDELNAYQKLLESRSALGLVVARVIHDGRRYLEPMASATKLLIDGKDILFEQTKKAEVVRKYYPVHAQTISTGVKGLSALFKALDPVSGRMRGRPISFAIRDVVETAANFMGDSLIEGGIDVLLEIDSSTSAYGYRGDLQNALLNILDNAIHWLATVTQPTKKINVFSKVTDKRLMIYVCNNGPLIDDSYVPKLFDAGFTLKSEGHGLGLVIAREACRASKGELYFDDTAPDTTFIIEFPIGEDK